MRYVLLLLLAGCATQEELAAQHAAEQAQYRNAVHAQCRGYGLTQGTTQFSECLMRVDMAYRQLLLDHALQEETAARTRALPYCSSLPPGLAGAYRAQGRCR